MLVERPDLVTLAIDFAAVDADFTAARAYQGLISSTTKQLASIATAGPVTDALADSIEATVRRFDEAVGKPILIEVAAPDASTRVVRALQAGERAFEAARVRALEVVERWEAALVALGRAFYAERDALTPTLGRFVAAATAAGVDLGSPDQIELTRVFGRFVLGWPLTGMVPIHEPATKGLVNA
jgi:hypothetical protein